MRYIVRWKSPEGLWHEETFHTFEAAEAQFKRDQNYFYDTVEVQLLEVSERVVYSSHGSHKRSA